jgi:hypothetical protein
MLPTALLSNPPTLQALLGTKVELNYFKNIHLVLTQVCHSKYFHGLLDSSSVAAFTKMSYDIPGNTKGEVSLYH